jgi:hypothetical protein
MENLTVRAEASAAISRVHEFHIIFFYDCLPLRKQSTRKHKFDVSKAKIGRLLQLFSMHSYDSVVSMYLHNARVKL